MTSGKAETESDVPVASDENPKKATPSAKEDKPSEAGSKELNSKAETSTEEIKSKYEVPFPVVCPGHSRPVVDVRYSSETEDGVFLISACHDKLPMVRWADNGDWIGTLSGHKGAVWSACMNQDATRAATGAADFTVKLWNCISGVELCTFDHKHIVKSVEISKDGSKLLTGGLDKTLRIYDLQSAADQAPPLVSLDANAKISKVSWLNDNTNIAVCGTDDGHIRKWDTRSGEFVTELKALDVALTDMEVLPDIGRLICSGGKSIKLYDSETLDLIHSVDAANAVEAVSLHPNGKRFICGGADLWVHEYEISETSTEIACHKGHHGPIFCIAYHPDGKTYASGSEDGTIRLWTA
mmetsp:Transcript_6403/g.7325  ORF Transcript_6403/g.7325 Transcript_6403/m.7325 type:complete len:354 (+) Transcript_6403:180-1241(+)